MLKTHFVSVFESYCSRISWLLLFNINYTTLLTPFGSTLFLNVLKKLVLTRSSSSCSPLSHFTQRPDKPLKWDQFDTDQVEQVLPEVLGHESEQSQKCPTEGVIAGVAIVWVPPGLQTAVSIRTYSEQNIIINKI